ncbi:MAG TPA: SDR family NAD(P)-dependent oxidoreductase [Anaerolineales bacterium]|nr:SDR family NAD(P)-dependent oxidoreductase [Anaerolineales bacterium]
MGQRVFLVTGATSGIGKAIAFGLAKTGEAVLLVARDAEKRNAIYDEIMGEIQNPNVDALTCDLSSLGSIRIFAAQAQAKYPKIDVLINTAAAVKRERKTNVDGYEMMFVTNHLGPFLLTHLLLDSLKASGSARILNITAPSTTKLNFEDLQSKDNFNYLNVFGATKMMNLLFTFELARRLEGTGVTANAVHPGLARSGLMRESPAVMRGFVWLASAPPQRVATDIVRLAILPQFEKVNGKFLHKGKEIEAPEYAHDREAQRKLWDISLELAGLSKEAADES